MAKLFSFASWNVEHFHGKPERAARVVDFLGATNPSVFAIYEVEGKQVFTHFMATMPNYNISITENPNKRGMALLIGVRNSFSSFVTQREEFRSKVPTLRPGALVTLNIDNQNYSLLFLHVKSMNDPRAWGLRDDMFKHSTRLKRKLDKRAGDQAPANFICLGDMNTMGLNATYNSTSDLDGDGELASVTRRFKAAKMRRLAKTAEESWWNGSDNWEPSKLDHVFASENLKFKTFDGGAEVKVLGWPEKNTKAEKRRWIDRFSDHGLLYGEVHS